ncbi:MAG: GWxTD domain-containing protein [candidate division Zixibacteria bacterium]|nr:GWxTD domain-containing protein [candidate division Zixibacteria bacterium]
MKALLGKEKYAEFVLLADTAEANAWLRKFWQEHDPTPTTAKNEFEEEHQRRIHHAIYCFGSSSRGGPPWDERGEVYIRYGDPNERRILDDGAGDPSSGHSAHPAASDVYGAAASDDPLSFDNAASEVWTYYRWNKTFQFRDKKGYGFYEMVPVTDPTLPPEDLSEFYASRLNAIDLQPAIYFHEYGKNLIDYALDVVRFHVGDNLWRVDVNLGYPLSVIGRGDDSSTISLRRTVVIRDDDQKDVYSDIGLLRRRIDSTQTSNRLMVEQKICELPSGNYNLAVTIDDLFTGKSGTYTKSFILPKFIVSEVHEISDIEMASFVWSIYEPGASFIKGDRMVMPLPSRIYLSGQELAFYYEIYNLLLGDDRSTHYTISYEIRDTRGKARFDFKEPGEFTSTARDVKQFGSIDLDKVPPGDYLLTIKVSDRVGRHDRSTIALFKKSG